MAVIEILLPKMGESVAEATITNLLVSQDQAFKLMRQSLKSLQIKLIVKFQHLKMGY